MNNWNNNSMDTAAAYDRAPQNAAAPQGRACQSAGNGFVCAVSKALWAHKFVLLAIIFCFSAIGLFYAKSMPPKFVTSAMLSAQNAESAPPAVTKLLGLRHDNGYEIETHIEVMRSHDMMARLADELSLQDDPEFAPELPQHTALSAEQKQLMMVHNLREAITIEPAGGGNLLKIEATATDPLKAANIANRLADIFIKEHLDIRYQDAQRVTDWMENKKSDLESAVKKDSKALRDFQAESGIVGSSNILQFHNQEFLQLNAQLLDAEKDYNDAKNRLSFVRQEASKGLSLYSIREVMNSPVIIDLKQRETKTQAHLAQIATKYGHKHPEYIAAKADLESLRSDINREVRGVINGLESDVKSEKKRIDSLKKRIADVKDKFQADRNEQLIRLQELQQNYEDSRKALDHFMAVYQQTAPQSIISDSRIKVISYARPAVYPNTAHQKAIILLCILTGFVVAAFAALMLERMNTRFKSINDIEGFTGVPIYAIVPETKTVGRNARMSRYVLDRPTSKAAESMRSLRMNLTLRAHESEHIQIVSFTSTHPHEGKSTLSTWFASLSAKAGERTLLIDCDMRRPKIHQNLGLRVVRSLVDYLTDRASLTDIIQHDEASGMDVIPCKATPSHALSLLTSAKMQAMLDELRDEYDLIILDAPAAASISDPYILAKLSDRSFYVVDGVNPDRHGLSLALKKFQDIQYYDLGLVINKVDFQKMGLESKRHTSYAYLDDEKAK